VIFTSDNYH